MDKYLLKNLRELGIRHDDWIIAYEAADRIEELETALKDIKHHTRIVSGMYQYSAIYQIANKVVPE